MEVQNETIGSSEIEMVEDKPVEADFSLATPNSYPKEISKSYADQWFQNAALIDYRLTQPYYWSMKDQDFREIPVETYPLICPDIYQIGTHWFVLISSLESEEGEIRRDAVYLGEDVENWSFSLEEFATKTTTPLEKPPLIILDPGHGGRDPGAVGNNGLYEKYYNQRLAGLLGEELEKRGFIVLYTYNPSKDLGPTLYERLEFASYYRNALFLSIHHNSSHEEEDRGFSIFFSSFNSEKATESSYVMVEGEEKPFVKEIKGISEIELFYQDQGVKSISLPSNDPKADVFVRDRNPSPIARSSFFFALSLFHHLNQYTEQQPFFYNQRLIDERDYRILKGNPNTSVLVELGFLSNPEESRKMNEIGYVRQLSITLADGIEDYCQSSTGNVDTLSLK